MKLFLIYTIGILLCKSTVKAVRNSSTASSTNSLTVSNSSSDDTSDQSTVSPESSILEEHNTNEDQLLDDALFQGLLEGYTFTLDCVTMSKHEENHDLPNGKTKDSGTPISEQVTQREHEQNSKEASLEASYMTKHRPLESAKVDKKEATLFHEFNILLHYLNSRGQKWTLHEPKDLGFEESNENHMVFKSEKNDSADIKIPENMFYSVGNMKKSIPSHKDNKKPIILTCMESFIVSRLGFLSMDKLVTSKAPVDEKLEYLNRWISIAKDHYILYLPYIAITAPRGYDILRDPDGTNVISDYSSNEHYKHLFSVCKKMVDLREDNGLLQTYVMLDSDLHPELMTKTINDKHMFPLLLQEKESTLKSIHEHHNHEMDWDEFQQAGNMILAALESQVLTKYDKFLQPSNWGIGLNAQESKNAEMELIKLFVKSQKKLNLKVIQTVRRVSNELIHSKKKDDKHLKSSMIKFSEKEQQAAKRDRTSDSTLDKCMKEAEQKVQEDYQQYTSNSQSYIATKLQNFEHDSWMECVSSRILDKFDKICKESEDYCKNLMDNSHRLLGEVSGDSTAAIALENLHYVLTVALLKHDKLTMDDVKKYVLNVSKEEIKDMSQPSGASGDSSGSSGSSDKEEVAHSGSGSSFSESTNSTEGGSSSGSTEETSSSESTNETPTSSTNEEQDSSEGSGGSGEDQQSESSSSS